MSFLCLLFVQPCQFDVLMYSFVTYDSGFCSGIKGVDFGSFPLISKWIKESIVESLREYVTPKYLSFDIPAWLNDDTRIVSYF